MFRSKAVDADKVKFSAAHQHYSVGIFIFLLASAKYTSMLYEFKIVFYNQDKITILKSKKNNFRPDDG